MQTTSRRAFWSAFLILNILLIGVFVYAVLQQPGLLAKTLPGTFAPDLSSAHTGNMLVLAILLAINAVLITAFGIAGSKLRLLFGIVLMALALPAFCVTYTQATPNGAPLFDTQGTPIANYKVDAITAIRFTGDQFAGALLLDAPEIFHWRLTQAEPARSNIAFDISIFLYRALIGLSALVLLLSKWRGAKESALAESATATAAVETYETHRDEAMHIEPVHSGPVADTHDAHSPDKAAHDPADTTHDEHGHVEHGHDEHSQDQHGHDEHSHDDHDQHGHDEHSHDDHDHDQHGHDQHGHDQHGHDQHGHDQHSEREKEHA